MSPRRTKTAMAEDVDPLNTSSGISGTDSEPWIIDYSENKKSSSSVRRLLRTRGSPLKSKLGDSPPKKGQISASKTSCLTDPDTIVWAKLRGYPWWPGRVTALEKIPKELATIAKTHYRSGTMVAVYFFGSHDFSLVSIDALKPFSSNWDTFHDKNTTRRFTVALEEARDIVSHKSLLNKGNSSLDLSTQPESKSKKKTVKKVPTEKRSTKNQSSSENSMYNDNSTANNSFIKSKISSKRRPQSIRDLKIAADGSASVEYLKYCRHKLQKILLRPQPKPREMSICKKILVDLNATPVSVPGLYATNLARVLRLYLDKAGDGRQSTQDDFLTKEVHDLVTKILSDWQHTVIDYIAQVALADQLIRNWVGSANRRVSLPRTKDNCILYSRKMSKLPLEFDDSQLSDIIDGKDSNEVQYGPEDVLLVDNLDYNPDTQVPSSSHITKIKSPMGTTAGQILYNTLPTSMKHSQYTIPTFLGIFVLFIFFPIKLYAFIILVGLIVGYSLGVESETRFDDYFSIFSTRISLNKSNYDGEHRTGSIRGEHLAHVDGSSQTDESPFYPEFLRLIEDISRDLVDPWFNNISKEGGRDAFRGSFYMCMHGALAKILAMLRNRSKDALTLLIYGISNSLKMHISEFRKWEETSSGNKSDQSIERFLKTNSKRRVEVACDLERELSFLRETAAQLIERLMPKKELESELVRSFLTEVIGANALFALAEKITDPDWINQQIITKLQRPEEIYPSVSPGWNLMMLRMVRIRFTPLPTSAISQNLDPIKSRGLHLILNIAGRRVNTHRIIQEADISMEQYRFKLSDRVVGRVDMPFRVGVHLVMHTCDPEDSESCDIMRRRLHNTTSVVQYRSGRCAIVGSVKISPTFTTAYPQTNHSWIKFTPKTNVPTDELFDGRGLPEIMLEITVMSGSPSENIVSKEVVENIDTNAALDFVSQSNLPDVLPLLGKNSSVDSGQSAVENLKTLLFSLISNHEHYMELLEYTKSVNAPPYLQFLMNLDALHQFTSISAVKSPSNELINGELTSSDNYHQVSSPINLKTALTNEQIIRLKVIKRDSLDIFNTHLTPGGRYYIPVKLVLDEFSSYDDSPSNLDHQDLIDSIEADIKRSDSINSEGAYDGGPIGADIFKNLCDIVSTLFSREFMPGFMKSDSYVRIKVNAKTSTSSIIRIEEEDFKESTLSESPIKSSIDLGSGSVSESPKKTLFDDGDQRRLYPQIVANKNDAGVTRIAEQITICKHSLAIMQDRGEPQHHLIKKQQEIESLIRLLRQRESEMGRRMFDIIQGESDGALVDENLDRSNEQNGVFDEVNQEDWEGLDELLDLEGLSVSVSLVNIKSTNQKDSGSGGILSTVLNKAAAPISTIAGALSNSADSALYIVTLEKADDVEFGHVIRRVRRRYKDFARLHRHLSRNFTKVSKIPLPPIGSVASALESYLGVLVGDELVRQSLELRRFVSFVDDIVPDDEDSNYQGATDPVTGENKNFLYGINTSSSDFKYSAKNTLSNGETYSKKRWAVMGSRSTIASIGRKFRGAINTGISVIGGVSSSPNLNLIGEDYGSDRSRSETSIHELTLPLRDEIESKSDSRFIEHLDISKPKKEVSNAIDKNSIKKIDSLDSDVILEQISFTEEEAEMLVEIFFSLITETFDLQQPNQWLRLRLLAIFKQILKQAYGDALAKALSDQINSTLTPPSIRSYPVKIREFVYPLVPPNALRKSTGVSEDKSFINEEELTMTDEAKLKKSVSKGDRMFIIQHQKEFPLPMRSDDERYATMLAARAVLLRYISQASMTTSLERLVGHYSMVSGVTRIFAALQHRKLNKVLFYSLLDCIVKLLLTDIE